MKLPALVDFVAAATLLALTLAPGASDAKTPDGRFSTFPEVLVGTPAGSLLPSCGAPEGQLPERTAAFRIVLHDISNAPLWFVPVTLDLSQTPCRLYADDRPGTTVNCAARTIVRLTDSHGVVEFAPRFSGGCAEALVMVSANGVPLRAIPARSTDLDGDAQTGLGDFWSVARNFLNGGHDSATDFDPCAGAAGTTSLADFAVFNGVMLRGGSGAACP